MRRAITVERDVEVEIDLRIATQGSLADLIDVSFDQRIRRDDDAADAVVLDKEINDLDEIAPQPDPCDQAGQGPCTDSKVVLVLPNTGPGGGNSSSSAGQGPGAGSTAGSTGKSAGGSAATDKGTTAKGSATGKATSGPGGNVASAKARNTFPSDVVWRRVRRPIQLRGPTT